MFFDPSQQFFQECAFQTAIFVVNSPNFFLIEKFDVQVCNCFKKNLCEVLKKRVKIGVSVLTVINPFTLRNDQKVISSNNVDKISSRKFSRLSRKLMLTL